jgi:nicotinamidase-related amidase
MDALRLGFKVAIVTDCVRGVDFPPGNVARRLEQMRKAGCAIIASAELE